MEKILILMSLPTAKTNKQKMYATYFMVYKTGKKIRLLYIELSKMTGFVYKFGEKNSLHVL